MSSLASRGYDIGAIRAFAVSRRRAGQSCEEIAAAVLTTFGARVSKQGVRYWFRTMPVQVDLDAAIATMKAQDAAEDAKLTRRCGCGTCGVCLGWFHLGPVPWENKRTLSQGAR